LSVNGELITVIQVANQYHYFLTHNIIDSTLFVHS